MSDNSFPVAAAPNQQEAGTSSGTALVDPATTAPRATGTSGTSAAGTSVSQARNPAESAFINSMDDDDDDNRIGGTVGNTVNSIPTANSFKGRVNEFLHNGEILRRLIIMGFLILFLTGAVFGLLSLQASNEAAAQRSLGRYNAEEIGPVLDFLSMQGFEYTVRGDSVLVPIDDYDKVREAMLRSGVAVNKIAEQDALIMRDNGFGVSQRLEGERIKHSREMQLARAIERIEGVEHATVLLAIPRENVFARTQQRPSAAVVVTLQNGAYLTPENVNSVRFTVASSVHNMLVKDVTVTDQHGRLLSAQTTNNTADDRLQREFEMRTLREAQYRDKLDSILRPMLGEGNYSAEVDVTLDTTVEEETRQFFNPDNQSVRSETLREERGNNDVTSPYGVPGSLSNQPPANAVIPQQLRNGTANASDANAQNNLNESREAVRNYEVDTTVRHTIRPSNLVQRLTVSVAVDNFRQTSDDGSVTYVPRTQEDLNKIADLVRGGLGLNESRGDFVMVENVAFPHDDAQPALPWWQQESFLRILRIGGAVLIILFLVVFVVRPMINRLLHGRSTDDDLERQLELDNGSALGGEDDLNLIAAQNELNDQIYNINREGGIELPNLHRDEDLLNAVRTLVSNEPQLSAEVVRDWINADMRDKKDKKKANKQPAGM